MYFTVYFIVGCPLWRNKVHRPIGLPYNRSAIGLPVIGIILNLPGGNVVSLAGRSVARFAVLSWSHNFVCVYFCDLQFRQKYDEKKLLHRSSEKMMQQLGLNNEIS